MNASKEGIKTADFARICGTTKRTLIHYEEIGLFLPAWRDENGYRYYSGQQYELFGIIDTLRSLGMPLSEIRAYLERRSPDALEALLTVQEQRIDEELRRLQRIRGIIRTKRELLKTSADIRCGIPALAEEREEILICSEPAEKDPSAVLRRHLAAIAREGLQSGHPFGAMIRAEDVAEGRFGRYACYFTKVSEGGAETCHRKPAGTYAVIHLRGDYRQPEEAMKTLLRFVEEQGLEPWGYCYKEGIVDEVAARDPAQYITKISIPVR